MLWAASLEPLAPGLLAWLTVGGLVGVWLFQQRPNVGFLWRSLLSILRLGGGLTLLYALLSWATLGLRQVLPEFTLHFFPAWPWPIVSVMAVTLLGTVWFTYPPRIQHLSPWLQRLLLGMRFVAAVLLLLAMLRPEAQWTQKNDRAAIFAILRDVSRSMNTRDALAGASRLDAQNKLLVEQKGLLTQLEKNAQVPQYLYAQDLLPLTEDEIAKLAGPAKGEQTALGFSLEALLKGHANQPLVGVLMLGDFAQRALPPYDNDPRLVAQRFAEMHIPINTVCFGAASLGTTGMDVIAEDLLISPTVFVKNQVIVGAKIRALGVAGKEITVRLLVEDATSSIPGQAPEMRVQGLPVRIKPTANEAVLPVELNFIPQQPGEFRVTLEAVPVEGELITANNQLTTYLTVMKGGLSVAYFDRPRPELRPIKQVAESADIQLDYQVVRYGPRFNEFRIEESWFDSGKYDVYILGDIPADLFQVPGSKNPPLNRLAEAVDRGAGLLMLGGFHSYGGGGYASTPLAAVLPVMMNPSEKIVGEKIDPSLHYHEDLNLIPTPLGLQHFVMRIAPPAENATTWSSLPPLKGANKFGQLKPIAQVLASSENGIPLLVAQEFGRGRVMAFAGDTTWRWALAGKGEPSQRFWRQLILWLAHKELQGDSNVWLRLGERRFRPGQQVDFTFGAKNPEGQPVTDAQFTVQITPPKSKQPSTVAPQNLNGEMTGKFTDTRLPGEYIVQVSATQAGKLLGAARSRFLVYEHDLELHNPAADPGFAAELALTTGGKSIPPEELDAFLKELVKNPLRPDDKRISERRLWDHWLFVVLFVSIMTIEWTVRKGRGLV